MKYYCSTCGSVLNIGESVNLSDYFEDGLECYFDWEHGNMRLIPDYETPAQYKKRTGKPYPDDGPVWARDALWKDWLLCRWKTINNKEWLGKKENIAVIADPIVPPPLEWRPE
jgi:hypothetical protein